MIGKTNEKGIVCDMDTIKGFDDTIKNKTSEAQAKARNKYDAENMKHFTLGMRNDVYNALEVAVQKSGIKRNKWIVTAILEKLESEGYLQE